MQWAPKIVSVLVSEEPNKLADDQAEAPADEAAVAQQETAESVADAEPVADVETDAVEQDEAAGTEPTGEVLTAEVTETEVAEVEVAEAEESAAEELTEASDESEAELTDEIEDEDDEDVSQEGDENAKPIEEVSADSDEDIKYDWYILKVQSNREKSIAANLKRKIAVEGLDRFFDDVVVPMEKVTEFKGGKKKIVERKLYPGYIVVHMHINDDTWFAVRETSGIGDFTGSGGKPTPMLPHEVARIIQTEEEVEEEAPKLNIGFKLGDRVKVKEGTFESFEGEVNDIDEQSGRITVMINIFGRSTPVELEYWQAEPV